MIEDRNLTSELGQEQSMSYMQKQYITRYQKTATNGIWATDTQFDYFSRIISTLFCNGCNGPKLCK